MSDDTVRIISTEDGGDVGETSRDLSSSNPEDNPAIQVQQVQLN